MSKEPKPGVCGHHCEACARRDDRIEQLEAEVARLKARIENLVEDVSAQASNSQALSEYGDKLRAENARLQRMIDLKAAPPMCDFCGSDIQGEDDE